MRIGRISGVEIHLNNVFLLLLGVFFAAGVLGKGLIAFATVFLHELGHVLVARRHGVYVSEVELLPFGGVSRMGSEVVFDPLREAYVSAAGPATNLLLVGLGLGMKHYGIWHDELGPFFIQCNLMVAAFNLLPALPLDGGRVFRAYLAKRIGIKQATYQAAWWGQFWGAVIVVASIAGLAFGVSGMDIVATGLFLVYAATREKSFAAYHFIRHLAQKKGELVKAGVLPGEPLVAFDSVRLGDIIRNFVPQRFHLVLLLDKEWRFKGIVSEAQIVDALIDRGFDTPVGNLKNKE